MFNYRSLLRLPVKFLSLSSGGCLQSAYYDIVKIDGGQSKRRANYSFIYFASINKSRVVNYLPAVFIRIVLKETRKIQKH